MDIFIWVALNVVVAMTPVFVLIAARRLHSLPMTLGDTLGDGFLYFFTVVLAAGIITDTARAAEQRGACPAGTRSVPGMEHCVSSDFLIMVIIGGSFVGAGTLLAYGFALARKFSQTPGNGRGSAIQSMFLASAAMMLTLYVRNFAHLW